MSLLYVSGTKNQPITTVISAMAIGYQTPNLPSDLSEVAVLTKPVQSGDLTQVLERFARERAPVHSPSR